MAEQLGFLPEGGGSIPTPSLHLEKFRVALCRWSDLVPILVKHHYRKGSIGGSIKVCLGVYQDGYIVGGGVFGKAWHDDKYSEDGKFKCLELRRLCFLDEAPKNTESWAIGKFVWWLRKNTDYNRILSYSDSGAGHSGTIYKASGFRLVGETAGGKKVRFEGREYHMRSLTIDRDYARNLARAVNEGRAEVVDTGIKRIWIRDF